MDYANQTKITFFFLSLYIVYKKFTSLGEEKSSPYKKNSHTKKPNFECIYYLSTNLLETLLVEHITLKNIICTFEGNNTYPIITFSLISTSVPFKIDSGVWPCSLSGPSPERPSKVRTRFDFTSSIVSVYPTSCRYLHKRKPC